MYCKLGNVREGLVEAGNERNKGRVPSSVFGGDAFPKSNSSQLYVNASPFGSVTFPLSMNGVLAGIEKLLSAAMVGAPFPVGTVVAHVPAIVA